VGGEVTARKTRRAVEITRKRSGTDKPQGTNIPKEKHLERQSERGVKAQSLSSATRKKKNYRKKVGDLEKTA